MKEIMEYDIAFLTISCSPYQILLKATFLLYMLGFSSAHCTHHFFGFQRVIQFSLLFEITDIYFFFFNKNTLWQCSNSSPSSQSYGVLLLQPVGMRRKVFHLIKMFSRTACSCLFSQVKSSPHSITFIKGVLFYSLSYHIDILSFAQPSGRIVKHAGSFKQARVKVLQGLHLTVRHELFSWPNLD